MDADHYECAVCGQVVLMADLGQVLFHEHLGITNRVDLDGVDPGTRVSDPQNND